MKNLLLTIALLIIVHTTGTYIGGNLFNIQGEVYEIEHDAPYGQGVPVDITITISNNGNVIDMEVK